MDRGGFGDGRASGGHMKALRTFAIVGCLLVGASATAQELIPVGRIVSSGVRTSEASSKIVSSLRALTQDFALLGGAQPGQDVSERFSSAALHVDVNGRVQVYVSVDNTDAPTLTALERRGLDIELANGTLQIIQGWVPIQQLEFLAQDPAVLKIRPPSYAFRRTGSVNTEGDAIHRCDQARALGVTGAGASVGVISDGVSGLATSQASGDLSSVQVLSAGIGDEGTAMLEVVHDCAPDAPLLFSTGFPTSLAFINAVNGLRDAGAKIIVDDLGFYLEPYFEDGPIASNDRAVGNTVLRVSSAGNDGFKHYQGTFTAGAFDPEVWGTRHLFGPGDSLLRFRVGGGFSASIFL